MYKIFITIPILLALLNLAIISGAVVDIATYLRINTKIIYSGTSSNMSFTDYAMTHTYGGRGYFNENNLVINTGHSSPYKVVESTPYMKTSNIVVNDIDHDQLNEVVIPYVQVVNLGYTFNFSVNVKIYKFMYSNNTIYKSLIICPLYRNIENSSYTYTVFKIKIYDLDIDNDNTVEIIGYTMFYNYLTNITSTYIWYIDYYNKTYRTKSIEFNITGSQPNMQYVDLGYLRNSSKVFIVLGVPFYNGTYNVYIISLNEGIIMEYKGLVGSYGLIASNGQYSSIATYYSIINNDSISSLIYLYLIDIDLNLEIIYIYNYTKTINRTDIIEQPLPPSQGIPPSLIRQLIFIKNNSLVLGIINDMYMAIYKYDLVNHNFQLENFSLYNYMLKPESIDPVFYINYIVTDIDHNHNEELVVFTSTINDSLAYVIVDYTNWNIDVKYDEEFSIDFSISSVIASADLDGDKAVEVIFLRTDPPSIIYYTLEDNKYIEISLDTIDQTYIGRSRVFFPIIISDIDNDLYIELSLILPNQILIINNPFKPIYPLPEPSVIHFIVLVSITLLIAIDKFRKSKTKL